MKKGILTRVIITRILYDLKKTNKNFDDCFQYYINKYSLCETDKKFIHNIVFTTIRNETIIYQIVKLYVARINRNDYKYLIIASAVAQIYKLEIKSYAVINSSCEAYKILNKTNSSKFINAVLRNIDRDKDKITNLNLSLKFPNWLNSNIKLFSSKQKKSLYKSILKKPTLHICSKNYEDIKNLNVKYKMTSKTSAAITEQINVSNLNGYKEGKIWVQDYGATLAAKIMGDVKNKKILDMCAAPGGKSFQLLNSGAKLTAYDISEKRINLMNQNIQRLKLNLKVINQNVLNINEEKKYDAVLIDAPCSATGTLRRNPEILYRNKAPDIKALEKLQYQLIVKASKMLKINGLLYYVVCSIIDSEGRDQIIKFIKKSSNYKIIKISANALPIIRKLLTKEGFLQSYPNSLKELGGIDGFFIARLVRLK
ncbi:MAG: Ribosomal RNA small subunit methyltransferase B [Alphaproteobacteria bacterium MarineAlpha5_Bin11]|nr:hypothetical protein [Pelagibacteraceae bacterium]PPR44444.1 MAG: Ribosomal RNA small subunit methyltransferase B [Alphaproteobacteria bacterium MarineAlpha5_Bin11]PPR51882.1 MAG: Ribosomal RNA small subunit methyltransferase B [Alphaproteobacteria bacterium MarineAlpha5_Bin10]|tara:strand:- start:12865 stop:14142 length:1278 start_codon:yes stop_codon:yes gene_type:complete